MEGRRDRCNRAANLAGWSGALPAHGTRWGRLQLCLKLEGDSYLSAFFAAVQLFRSCYHFQMVSFAGSFSTVALLITDAFQLRRTGCTQKNRGLVYGVQVGEKVFRKKPGGRC